MDKDEETGAKSPEERLIEAKINFLNAVDNYDPLRPIKDHPWLGMGAAFVSGVGLSLTKINLKDISLLPLVLQMGNNALKYLLDSKK